MSGSEKSFRVGDIRPNPYRDLVRFPPNPAQVANLRESIRSTGWWENVVARLVDGVPELAYGHTRIEALRQELGDDHRVRLIIKPLDNAEMVKVMVHENVGEHRHSQDALIEGVRSVVLGYAEGLWTLPKVGVAPGARGSNRLSFAPGFLLGSSPNEHPYTAATVAEFLGVSRDSVDAALTWLSEVERGTLTNEMAQGVSTRNAEEVVRAAHAAERAARGAGLPEPERVAREVAEVVANEVREGRATLHGSALVPSISDVRARAIRERLPLTDRAARPSPPAHSVALGVLTYVQSFFDRTFSGSNGSYADLLNAVAENAGNPGFRPLGDEGIHLDAAIAQALRDLAQRATEYADRIEAAEREVITA